MGSKAKAFNLLKFSFAFLGERNLSLIENGLIIQSINQLIKVNISEKVWVGSQSINQSISY